MRRRRLFDLAWWRRSTAAAAVLLAGCASAPPLVRAPEPRPLGGEFEAYHAPPASTDLGLAAASTRAAPPADGPITLPQALERGLAGNPELAAFSWEVRTREANALQAGLLPNPELEAEVEEFGGSGDLSGFGASETTLLVSQPIETAGKRPKRRRAAEFGAEVAGWAYETARLRVFATVALRFVGVLAAQERVALSEELLRVADSSVEAVEQLVSAGAASPVETTRVSLEAATARLDVAAARRELEAARAELAATWGGVAAEVVRAEGDLGSLAPPPPLDALRLELARSPELARWDREIARRAAVVALEDAQRIPDLTAAVGLRHLAESDDTALVAGVSVPLPLFDRNQGARAAARSDLHKARHERRAEEARLTAALDTAYAELVARHAEASALRDRILPSAEEAFEGVRRGYLRGLFRNVDVLDAQRQLFGLRLREIEALLAYHAAKAETERLTGVPLAPGPTAP